MNPSELMDIAELPKTFRPKETSPLWSNLPRNWMERLERVFLTRRTRSAKIFFRADDIGVPSVAFKALCKIFKHFDVPLALSVVPSWVNTNRANHLFQIAPPSEFLWSWHQHGWRHTNWEKDGKKAEFGPSRTENQKWQDLWKGVNKMREILGNAFVPVFTPPWNRITPDVLILLQKLGFKAISIDQKLITKHHSLKVFRIYLDLHTRKITKPASAFDALIEDCDRLFTAREAAGIMIHHNRMNINAFLFIAKFIELARKSPFITITSFRDMLEKTDRHGY